MTKLHPAILSNCDHEAPASKTGESEEIKDVQPSLSSSSTADQSVNNEAICDDSYESDGDSEDDYDEPLGYHDFLYDVNIEYSPGGTSSSPLGNRYCFKMKRLPYMVELNNGGLSHNSSIGGSSSDINCCDKGEMNGDHPLGNQTLDLTNLTDAMQIDVTRETCAFLGNSDFVPTLKNTARRVILELVSAKLSQSSGYNIPPNSSLSSLTSLADKQQGGLDTTPNSRNNYSSVAASNHDSNSIDRFKIVPPQPPASPSSSRKFVNYTILIKTVPGLDKHPGVIDRRFSDFLNLYQGLKSDKVYADIIDKHVIFPKKVYMGNFTLEKIAERSIEFTRLLNVCMENPSLVWSVPFVSFLIDRELKEAHRLSLLGDPDDVQALIENAYYIEKKLYFRKDLRSRSSSSSCSLDLLSSNSPTLPNGRLSEVSNQSALTSTISFTATNDPDQFVQQMSSEGGSNELITTNLDRDSGNSNRAVYGSKENLTPINQRILVTFCMLFVTYCRSQNYHGLRQAICEFGQLISSQEYVDSLINTRHYYSLRVCFLFLMNLNHEGVVEDDLRMVLKRRLEDIDGTHVELSNKIAASTSDSRNPNNIPRRSSLRGDDISNLSSARLTRKDLTSLLRDRHFCSFQDGKFSNQ